MSQFLFQLIFIFYIILLIFYVLDLQKYNVNAIIQKCNTDAQINNSIINLNPVLFTINYPLDVKDFIYMDN